MLTKTLITLFKRDLNAIKKEINTYNDEEQLWVTNKDISNSAGNLALHLIGNLNHFIGAVLGHTGYVRQRELEFSLKDIPVIEITKQIEETITVIEHTLQQLTETDLQKNYKLKVFKDLGVMSTEYFLIHLAMHLAYHLGQINYHRRLLDKL